MAQDIIIETAEEDDVWPLETGDDNDRAFAWFQTNRVGLIRVADAEHTAIDKLKDTTLVFATPWDPFSATRIGSLKRALDKGNRQSVAIVFFDSTAKQVRQAKAESWYFDLCYVLDKESKALIELIGRVPFSVSIDSAGRMTKIREGK